MSLLDPTELAMEILTSEGGRDLPGELLDDLAVALSRGEGVAKVESTVCIVLRNPLQASAPGAHDFRPTLLTVDLKTQKNIRSRRPTATVAQHLTTIVAPGKLSRLTGYVPASGSKIRGLYGGCLATAPTNTITLHKSNKQVTWYSLNEVSVGSIVYAICTTNVVHLIQKIGSDHWVLVRTDATKDVVDMPLAVRNAMRSAGLTEVQGLKSIHGKTVLIRR